MRLQELYFICKKACENWVTINATSKNYAGEQYLHIDNWADINCLLDSLYPISPLSEKISKIQHFHYAHPGGKSVDLYAREYRTLEHEYTSLHQQVQTLRDACEFLNIQNAEYGFDIKLPDGISLDELSKCTKDLNNVFSTCPIFSGIDASVEFSAVDIGSTWLSFVVGGTGVVSFLAALAYLADRAMTVYSHFITCKQQEEVMRALKLSNDIIEAQHKTHSEVTNALLSNFAESINQEHGISGNEALEQTKYTLKTLSDWLGKGMEIHSSINASPEVKAIFPPVEKPNLPEATLKMLTEGSEDK